MRAIDTNVLVRALVRDDVAQSSRAEALLTSGEKLYIPITVILECEWVLRSRYGFSPKLIAGAIQGIAAMANTVVGERNAVLEAAAKAAQGWDFVDALHHALSVGCDDFVTLDAALVKRSTNLTQKGIQVVPKVTKL